MEFDNSWQAVFDPGQASDYFDPHPGRSLTPVSRWSVTNAWWLAELSRLVYRSGAIGGSGSRDGVLAGVGLRESVFLDRDGTQCAIVEPRGAVAAPFAALVFRGTDGPADWRTNISRGARAEPFAPDERHLQLARTAAGTLM